MSSVRALYELLCDSNQEFGKSCTDLCFVATLFFSVQKGFLCDLKFKL